MKNTLRCLCAAVAVSLCFIDASFAQSIVIQEGDTVYICEPGPVALHAQFTGTDSSDLESSTPLSTIDDTHSGVVDIGFPFTFYGNTYTQCVLSTNFYITFDLSNADQYSAWPINSPLPDPGYPTDNAIFGPWQDTYPGAFGAQQPGWVSYTTIGEAPNRIFIFNMCMVPMFSCVEQFFSGQIKLFETTNNIEIHITHKDVCTDWNDGQAIMGLQNSNGTVAEVVNGYDAGVQWYAENEAWLLTPNGPGDYNVQPTTYDPVQVYATNQLQWYGNGLPGPVYSDTTIVDITQSGWVYVDFFGCFGTTLAQAGSDSIYIAIGDPATVTSQRVSACNNPAENALFANFLPSETAPFSLVWTDSLGNVLQTDSNETLVDSLVNIPAGHYNLAVTNAVGCVLNYPFDVPVYTMTPDFVYAPSLICQGAPVSFTNLSTGSITGYGWNFGDVNNSGSTDVDALFTYDNFGDSFRVIMTIRNDTFQSCLFRDTAYLKVHANIVADAVIDSPLCEGQIVLARDKSKPHPIAWQWFDGDSLHATTANTKFQKPAGVYPVMLVVVDSLCGVDTLTDMLLINPYPIVNIGADTLMCPGENITLDAGNPGKEYAWSNGMNTQTIDLAPTVSTLVSVQVDNQGCVTTDERFIEMNCSMIFPNAFTPNGDGVNDYFVPHLINMKSYEFFVYNRWGQLVYASIGGTGEFDKGWDGTYHNEKQPIASYVYYAQGFDIKDQPVKTMGTFTLLR